MRRRITMYIADREVDLSEDSLVLMNYTFEDLSNPTVIKNSYSKKIKLMGTKTNNSIFGEVWRLDRSTLYGDTFTGPSFDATRKTPFTIMNERREVLVEGYCKLDNITRDGSSVEYDISLYGGLGLFFYNLSYNADGTKRTLLDMTYPDMDGNPVDGVDVTLGTGRGVVDNAWKYLSDPDSFDPGDQSDLYYNIINFAPCYNGIPADFDSNKAICRFDEFTNVPNTKLDDKGSEYTRKQGQDSLLLTFGSKHTEWDMQDIRWYLQRPVINLQMILNAIADPANNGGYQVRMNIPVVHDVWLTLPMIPTKYRDSASWTQQVLKSTLSPAEILISYSKMYGFVFIMDQAEKKLTIRQRKDFFKEHDSEIIDMTGRIDSSSISINPNVADHRFYQMGGGTPSVGQFAKDYTKDFGREFGIQKINTGYEFDLETKVITKDLKLAEAVDVTEYSKGFVTTEIDRGLTNLPQPNYEQVEVQLWNYYDQTKSMNVPVNFGENVYIDQQSYPFSDWLPKVQFHEEENKPSKGESVLLFFNGFAFSPLFIEQGGFSKQYMISEDTKDMEKLNNNRPCWNLYGWTKAPDAPYMWTKLPCFLRDKIDITALKWDVLDTFNFGLPLAVGTLSIYNPNEVSIYNKHWRRYLSDRYDTDTKVMKCRVDLNGLRVDQNLLGRFFFYESSIWVLNKVENYSLTSDDLVECEFVKVKDIKNYTE